MKIQNGGMNQLFPGVRILLGPVIVEDTLTVPARVRSEAFSRLAGSPEDSSSCASACGSAEVLSPALFCLNFLGDGLRDALDPRGRKAAG